MTQNKRDNNATTDSGAEGENGEAPKYFIDLEASGHGRSVPVVIGERRCHTHRQHEIEDAKPAALIKQITGHCKDTSDYLLPDTPIKEAIFRVLLSNGNEPLTPEEVSQILSDRWAMSASPRDLSPWVIQRLMDHSPSYFVTRVPEPEPPPEEVEEGEAVEQAKEVEVAEGEDTAADAAGVAEAADEEAKGDETADA